MLLKANVRFEPLSPRELGCDEERLKKIATAQAPKDAKLKVTKPKRAK
jgi:hypothetical protein